MVARLWWKEARMFWPIWVFLIIVAVAIQILVLHYQREEAKAGALAFLALGWTCFYAFAVTAASFAGERENRTLDLLDALPIERWRLWTAKSSFALLTTLALGLVLLGLAAAGSTKLDFGPRGVPWGIFAGVVIVLEVLGWGLFWSALLSNALAAAAVAVCSAGLSVPIVDSGLNLARQYGDEWPIELALAVFTAIISAGLFVKLGPPRKAILPRGWPQSSSRTTVRPEPIVAPRASGSRTRFAFGREARLAVDSSDRPGLVVDGSHRPVCSGAAFVVEPIPR